MEKYYRTDDRGVFVDEIVLDPFAAVPPGTDVPPPDFNSQQFAQWNGVAWIVLNNYPPMWPALNDAKADVKSCAQRMACEMRNTVTAGISSAEMASWPIKQAEAAAYAKTQDAATAPALKIEADARGMPLSDLVDRVLRNAQQLAALEAMIAGRCGAICDAADAAQSFDDLDEIKINDGWPL